MKFIYIKNDRVVIIDNEYYKIDNSNFNQEIDVIQWNEDSGEIEYIDRQTTPNSFFTDSKLIEPLVNLWNIEKQKNINLSSDTQNTQSITNATNFISINQNIIDSN